MNQTLESVLGLSLREPERLQQALRHPSQRHKKQISAFERYEFLGDRVLGLVIAEQLLETFPHESEGALAKRHAQLVRTETLAAVAQQWRLGEFIDVASSERLADGQLASASVLADACEAVIAVVFLDQGFDVVRGLVRRTWQDFMTMDSAPPIDPKSALQEWVQGQGLPLPQYRLLSRSGPDHAPQFRVIVEIKDLPAAEGGGNSLRAAEKAAAAAWLMQQKAMA